MLLFFYIYTLIWEILGINFSDVQLCLKLVIKHTKCSLSKEREIIDTIYNNYSIIRVLNLLLMLTI